MKIIHKFLEIFLDFRHFGESPPQKCNFVNEAAQPKTCKMAHVTFGCAAVIPRAHRSASQRQRKEVRKHVFPWFLSHFSYILLYICRNDHNPLCFATMTHASSCVRRTHALSLISPHLREQTNAAKPWENFISYFA